MTTEQVQVKEPNAPQQLALQQLQQHRDQGLNKSLVVLPSGAGKTYLAAFDTKQAGAKSVLFLVHRREILQQAADTFKQVHNLSEDQIGFVMQEYKEFGRPFTFSTIQTASRPKNLDILSKYKFDYVIIDEYHHVAAPNSHAAWFNAEDIGTPEVYCDVCVKKM
jgi:superfamily II DNA or RNA helicase